MNFKVRFKNPVFVAQLFLAILTPILVYANLTVQDITSWSILGNVLLNIKDVHNSGLRYELENKMRERVYFPLLDKNANANHSSPPI